jgi:DNA adenine methylase
LRYHGGKWLLAPWIISHFPPHRVYVEPFGGAASVLLRKERSYAEVYNDLDGEIVNVFRVLRESPELLLRALELTPFARDEFVESYTPAEDRIDQARRTVVRSYLGFGSNSHNKKTGFRANSNRSGTTPAHDWQHFPECLKETIERLRGVVIENRDALAVMASHDGPDTLYYCDPPYAPETRDAGGDYRHELTPEDHGSLLVFLRGLQGYVILSGYPSSVYDDGLPGWLRINKTARADGARLRTECLWISPRTQLAMPQGRLDL